MLDLLAGDAGVDLRGLDIGMPQHLGYALHRYALAERHRRKGMTSQMEGESLLYATYVGDLLEVGIHLLVGEDGEKLPVFGSRTRAILLDDGLGDVQEEDVTLYSCLLSPRHDPCLSIRG